MSVLSTVKHYIKHVKTSDGNFQKVSEWTKAKDVEFEDGTNIEDALSGINDEMNALKKSVSDGKSTVASAITSAGVSTASDASFSTIAQNITSAVDNGKNDVTLSVNGRIVTASNGRSTSVSYAGSNGTVTVTPTAGNNNETIDIADGWTTSIIVNRKAPYDSGYSAGYNAAPKYHLIATGCTGQRSFSVPAGLSAANFLVSMDAGASQMRESFDPPSANHHCSINFQKDYSGTTLVTNIQGAYAYNSSIHIACYPTYSVYGIGY